MNRIKVFGMGILAVVLLVGSVEAETIYDYQVGQVYSSPPGPSTFTFTISPFDTSLGTLNSVSVYAEVNVSGSAQLWSPDEFAELSVEFVNSLGDLPEMGWGVTEAKYEATEPLWYYDYDLGEGYVQVTGSGNQYNSGIIFSDFGRFAGSVAFEIDLNLSGMATPSGTTGYDIAVSYDGDARLTYEYDYTPVAIPEPSTWMLVSLTLVPLFFRRKRS